MMRKVRYRSTNVCKRNFQAFMLCHWCEMSFHNEHCLSRNMSLFFLFCRKICYRWIWKLNLRKLYKFHIYFNKLFLETRKNLKIMSTSRPIINIGSTFCFSFHWDSDYTFADSISLNFCSIQIKSTIITLKHFLKCGSIISRDIYIQKKSISNERKKTTICCPV